MADAPGSVGARVVEHPAAVHPYDPVGRRRRPRVAGGDDSRDTQPMGGEPEGFHQARRVRPREAETWSTSRTAGPPTRLRATAHLARRAPASGASWYPSMPPSSERLGHLVDPAEVGGPAGPPLRDHQVLPDRQPRVDAVPRLHPGGCASSMISRSPAGRRPAVEHVQQRPPTGRADSAALYLGSPDIQGHGVDPNLKAAVVATATRHVAELGRGAPVVRMFGRQEVGGRCGAGHVCSPWMTAKQSARRTGVAASAVAAHPARSLPRSAAPCDGGGVIRLVAGPAFVLAAALAGCTPDSPPVADGTGHTRAERDEQRAAGPDASAAAATTTSAGAGRRLRPGGGDGHRARASPRSARARRRPTPTGSLRRPSRTGSPSWATTCRSSPSGSRQGVSWGIAGGRRRHDQRGRRPPGLRPGTPYVLVGAHLDTVPQAPGAEDNASGVAVLLELARMAARRPAPGCRSCAWPSAPRSRAARPTTSTTSGRRPTSRGSTAPSARRCGGMVSLDRVGAPGRVPVCTGGLSPARVRRELLAAADADRRTGAARATTAPATTGRSRRRGRRSPGSAATTRPATTRAGDRAAHRQPAPARPGRAPCMWEWLRRPADVSVAWCRAAEGRSRPTRRSGSRRRAARGHARREVRPDRRTGTSGPPSSVAAPEPQLEHRPSWSAAMKSMSKTKLPSE